MYNKYKYDVPRSLSRKDHVVFSKLSKFSVYFDLLIKVLGCYRPLKMRTVSNIVRTVSK